MVIPKSKIKSLIRRLRRSENEEKAKISMTLEETKEKLQNLHKDYSMCTGGKWPWDRGYLEGYTNGLRRAYEMMCRIDNEENKE